MSEAGTSTVTIIDSLTDTLSAILIEAGILLMVGVWTVMWIFLGMQTAEFQGTLEAAIILVYTLTPVVGVLLWRLSERTRFDFPGIADLVDTPEEPDRPEPEGESEVAQRFETGG